MNAFIQQLQWFNKPEHNHLVQYYPAEDILLRYLKEFVRTGLENDEACVVIATGAHISDLKNDLDASNIDVGAVQKNGSFIAIDAKTTLDSFMVGGMPNWRLFENTLGPILESLASGGRQVRAYGEMVALLWEDNNPKAVIELEKFWNDISKTYSFSLYCAYPTVKFDGNQAKMVSEINHLHALAV